MNAAIREAVHGDDGTRYHECANYEGTVHQCVCGERFVDMSELRQHIAEEEEATSDARPLGVWAACAVLIITFWWAVWHWVGPVVARLL